MPYQEGTRLPGERASKLGHLDVIKSEAIGELIRQFDFPELEKDDPSQTPWTPFDVTQDKPLRLVFAVDGSLQVVSSGSHPVREVAFVKTALVRLDPTAVAKLDQDYPHPMAMRDMMKDSALFHAAAVPLKNIRLKGQEYQVALRRIVFDFMRDPQLGGEPYATLKWLMYRKWSGSVEQSPGFTCPSCGNDVAGLQADADTGTCFLCGAELFATDALDLHREMLEDSASMGLATSYMLIHELLMIFTAIRFFWENNRTLLSEALFVKDGPLTLRSQYSRLVPSIRDFLKHAHDSGIQVHLIGQEKSGAFFDHLTGIERFAPPHSTEEPPHFAVLSHHYVRKEVQRVRDTKDNEYGKRTNYGEKVYVKSSPYHAMVINVPPIQFVESEAFPAAAKELIGLNRIMATLPTLLSHRHAGALVPVELANGVASLSSYPSATVLKVFAGLA